MKSRSKINKFLRYNFPKSGQPPTFHDNDLLSIKIFPSNKSKKSTNIELAFWKRHWPVSKAKKRTLILKGCANLKFSIDFDVLAANASSPKGSAGQTSHIEMSDCWDCIKRLIKENELARNVEYSDEDNPANCKMYAMGKFFVVKILLHGGTLEIVAEDFEIKNDV
jgi:hypothetical protein